MFTSGMNPIFLQNIHGQDNLVASIGICVSRLKTNLTNIILLQTSHFLLSEKHKLYMYGTKFSVSNELLAEL